jgi:hypothetical protein
MRAPENPKYSDEDMATYARQLIEMSREVLPDDMRVLVVLVDGAELRSRRLRTRMVSNMGTKLTEAVFATAGKEIGQVVPAKKHYSLRLAPGRIGVKG